jgi:ssDNA-binding Zn-finger/Zn-ribbon topoisomerase 1
MTISVDNKYVRLISGRLRNFKQKKDNLYNFSCPICGDSQKNKLKARGYVYPKGTDLYFRCHNCSAGTNIAGLLKHVDSQLHSEYILERYKSGQANNSNTISEVLQLSVPKFDKLNKQKVFEHAEWLSNLSVDHYCIKYATNRKIPTKFHDKLLFTQHYERFITTLVPNHGKQILDDARLVIPFYNEYNELIAVSGRALETSDKTLRYVTIRTNDNQDKLIYGMDRVDLSKPVHIVEGPLDSLFLENCIASGDANLALTAKSISSDKIILVFDNEPRNKEIVKMMQNAIKTNQDIVIWPSTIGEKDINAMIMSGISLDEIQKIISSNTFKGIEAQLKFNMWKRV